MKLNDLNKQLSDARRNLSTAEIGEEGMKTFGDAVNNMKI